MSFLIRNPTYRFLPSRRMLPMAFSARCINTSRMEGSVSEVKGFSEKERAVENQWARMHDNEKLSALRKLLKEQRETTRRLQAEVNELKHEVNKKQ
ncbi:hypothetical protein BZG36_02772 [Bifiguratus adelaidae]|uniref:Uncharacterized protein n=1 Tax=Bifiguratus adelaidae TaxID=1938954 RepID=A0A261Y1W1_9FUNG|nr:hypothetical protein BZG36_02772 [Bifiguratus adelaidae]